MALDSAAPRILLFGHPGSGKSSLLGALLRAGETQGEILGAEVIDPTGRLAHIRDHVYAGAEFHNTHTELVTYEVRLRPWRIGSRPTMEPLSVVIMDCDGQAANALLKHPDPITERDVRGTVASAVVQADLIALVVNAGADDRELDDAFEEFLMFLERVHGRKAFEREVGGFPIFLVLTQCDRLARPGDTQANWEAALRKRRTHAAKKFAEFLAEQQPSANVDSPYLPFGSVVLQSFAVAVHGPVSPLEPYGVAECFREAFAAAKRHRERVNRSQRQLRRTLWSVAAGIWLLFAGAIAVSVYQPRVSDPGLAGRVQAFQDRDPPAAIRLAAKNLARNRRQLAEFQSDTGFFALPGDLRNFVNGRLQEIDDYRAYVTKLNEAPSPAEARSLDELSRTETLLNTELALPPQYTWGETEAAQLRDKWLADVPLLRAAEAAWNEWYRGLVNQALALTHSRTFEGDWRDRIAAIDAAATHPPFDGNAAIPGSQSLPQPRGEAVTYRIPFEFDRVYQASRDWEFARSRLEHLRDFADALGLTTDTSRRVLDLPPPGPGADSATLPGERLKDLPVGFTEWRLADFPEPGRTLLAARLHESLGHGIKHARKLLGAKFTGDTPDAWSKLTDSLSEPALQDWGRLLELLARFENPSALNPVVELDVFLRTKEFTLDAKGFDLAIPLALRVPALVPTGSLNITITPREGPASVHSLKLSGEGIPQSLGTQYRFLATESGPLLYHPGDGFKMELPVRSGDQRFTLVWDDGATKTFQFDRWRQEPKLVPATGTAEPATDVSLVLVPGSKWPRLPLLLPEVKR
ncbi:MAG TPA: GTPase domain-containing protein [Urbifossiella sp.]